MVVLISISAHSTFAQDSINGAYRSGGQQFFESLNDVPLMPGLYELLDESVVFDKAQGRIIESSAASDELAEAEIKGFYEQALPQMGWERITPQTFVRQDERLTMELKEQDNYSIVQFTVSPR